MRGLARTPIPTGVIPSTEESDVRTLPPYTREHTPDELVWDTRVHGSSERTASKKNGRKDSSDAQNRPCAD